MQEVLLKNFCTFGTGGKTLAVIAGSEDGLIASYGLPVFGGGSNVLFSEDGLPACVLINRTAGVYVDEKTGEVTAKSGQSLTGLSRECQAKGVSGLEWAYLLPGSVGGAVRGNAGAYGGQISDSLAYVDIIRQGKKLRLGGSEIGFDYRKSGLCGDDLVLSATFGLEGGFDREEIQHRMSIVKAKRAMQPRGRSAGSVFKRVNGISAGYYIEKCGLKGYREGGAVISPQHANFIINDDNAVSSDIYRLIREAEQRVFEQFGIELEREIKLIGDF